MIMYDVTGGDHMRKRLIQHLIVAAILLTTVNLRANGARPCPPDIDCNGAVNIDDLFAVIGAWGPVSPGHPADVVRNGNVNIDDLFAVIQAWGPCRFDFGQQYGNVEAHQIGLEMLGPSGPLTLTQALYDRIARDLYLIRAAYPALVSETHSPAWVPNRLIVSVQNPQGSLYVCHNVYYQVTSIQPLFSTWYTVNFAGKINVERLAQIYQANAGVSFAEPDGYIGGQNFWRPTIMGGGIWRWSIDDGFTDCTDGCDCHRYYVIDTDEPGNVMLISYTEQGQPWCVFNDK
jgi:hypothetical protein